MLSEELIELANKTIHLKAETQTLEVKAAHRGCPKRLYNTLSRFSSTEYGFIISAALRHGKGNGSRLF